MKNNDYSPLSDREIAQKVLAALDAAGVGYSFGSGGIHFDGFSPSAGLDIAAKKDLIVHAYIETVQTTVKYSRDRIEAPLVKKEGGSFVTRDDSADMIHSSYDAA